MHRAMLIVLLAVAAGCSGAKAERTARWTASCDACSWRTSGLVKHGIDWKDGDRCPIGGCRGRLVVQVAARDTPAPEPEQLETKPDVPFGLERYSR